MTADLFDEEDLTPGQNWSFEEETWKIQQLETTSKFPRKEGLEAAIEAIGPFTTCQTCRVEYVRPRTPISDPAKVCDVFPAVLAYPHRTVWILGFSDLSMNRETGCREVTLHLVSSDDSPHFTDPPNGVVKLNQRYFILEKVQLPEWIREALS
jgi:hypothetical protein